MRNWRGARVLVTGAGGFIGSHLAEALARRGAKVRAMLHYNGRGDWGLLEEADSRLVDSMEVTAGDISDPFFVSSAVEGQDVVFHLAALIAIPYSYAAPTHFVSTNVGGTLNVLQACLKHGTRRLVHTSTSETYGTAVYTPIDEKHPLQGQSPYSASKIGADMLAESFYRSFELPVTTVRPFNTYGPRQSARAVLPTIITQLLRGQERLEIGSLEPVRDFTFVEDTVDGFLAAASSPRTIGQVVNLGTGRAVSIRQAAELAMRLIGRRAEFKTENIRVRPAKSEVQRLLCDNRKAARLAGWKPRFSLEQGLVETIEYLRAHLSKYKEGYAV